MNMNAGTGENGSKLCGLWQRQAAQKGIYQYVGMCRLHMMVIYGFFGEGMHAHQNCQFILSPL
jgi:hypothetical protein